MTNNTIKHLGIVENIQGSHLSVRIVQTSACAACSAKGHCSSADSKDKIIDIIDSTASAHSISLVSWYGNFPGNPPFTMQMRGLEMRLQIILIKTILMPLSPHIFIRRKH